MSLTLIGKKRGMTRIFDKTTGKATPCTVIEIEPNVAVQVKTKEKDGTNAVQMGSFALNSSQKQRLTKPLLGHFAKKNIEPRGHLVESKMQDLAEWQVGKEVGVDFFAEGSFVDVRGRSKGRGYQGVIKRHGKHRIHSSHGAGPVQRHLGSIGSVRGHGRIFKNKRMAGHMGDENVVTQNLKVIHVDTELKALVVKGAIPGANGGIVYIQKAIKKA